MHNPLSEMCSSTAENTCSPKNTLRTMLVTRSEGAHDATQSIQRAGWQQNSGKRSTHQSAGSGHIRKREASDTRNNGSEPCSNLKVFAHSAKSLKAITHFMVCQADCLVGKLSLLNIRKPGVPAEQDQAREAAGGGGAASRGVPEEQGRGDESARPSPPVVLAGAHRREPRGGGRRSLGTRAPRGRGTGIPTLNSAQIRRCHTGVGERGCSAPFSPRRVASGERRMPAGDRAVPRPLSGPLCSENELRAHWGQRGHPRPAAAPAPLTRHWRRIAGGRPALADAALSALAPIALPTLLALLALSILLAARGLAAVRSVAARRADAGGARRLEMLLGCVGVRPRVPSLQ